MQQVQERQDRRTRTSAAGWQTGSESKLDAVQSVRHLTPIPGRGPRVCPLPVASGAVPISLPECKRRKQGNNERSESEGSADEVRALRQGIPAFRPWAASEVLFQVLPARKPIIVGKRTGPHGTGTVSRPSKPWKRNRSRSRYRPAELRTDDGRQHAGHTARQP